jgi:hypothetical protein
MESRTALRLSEVVFALAAGCLVLERLVVHRWGDPAFLAAATGLVWTGLACRRVARTELVYRFRDGVPVWNSRLSGAHRITRRPGS